MKTTTLQVSKWIEENQGKYYCQCGCGNLIVIKAHHKSRGVPKYISKHHPPYIRTEEIKANYRKAFKERPSHPNIRKGVTNEEFYGVVRARELAEKNRQGKVGQKQTKELVAKRVAGYKKSILQNKGNNEIYSKKSSYEKFVEGVIEEEKFCFRSVGQRGLFIESMGKVMNPDFVHKDKLKKVAIEVYGRYYKELGYGSEANWLRQRFDLYHNIGWDVLFLNDKDVTDRNIVKQKIRDFVEYYN